MQIGIGLPNPVPGVAGTLLVDWARRAEERGFAGLATIDRVAYPNHDSLTTLAAAAGATSRINLVTNILLAPVYPAALLAKTTASLDQLSGGRLTLGVAPGGRADDYAAAGVDYSARGRAMDDTLDQLVRYWGGEPAGGSDKPVGPPPVRPEGVPLLIGGTGDAAIRRTVSHGAGWTVGGGGPEMAAPTAETVRTAWREAGREGEPRLAALVYYSLGDEVEQDSRAYLLDYYAFLGDWAEGIAGGALRTPEAIRDTIRAFEDLGFTELYLDPTVASLDQVDRLADVAL